MQRLGITTLLAGFLGIPLIVFANITGNIPLTLMIHGGLWILLVAISIYRAGSPARWFAARVDSLYEVHPAVVVLIGILFALSGTGIALFIEPGDSPKAMNSAEITYFGGIFILLGIGVALTAVADWRHQLHHPQLTRK